MDMNDFHNAVSSDRVGAAELINRPFAVFVLLIAAAAILVLFFGRVRKQEITLPYENPYALGVVTDTKEGVIIAERIDDSSVEFQPFLLEILTDANTIFAAIPPVLNLSGAPAERIKPSIVAVGDRVYVYSASGFFADSASTPPEWLLSLEESVKTRRERIKADFVVKVGEE